MSHQFYHSPVRVVSSSLFGTASEALYARIKKIKRKDVECQAFFRKVVKSPIFQVIMISTITSNAAFMVLGTDYSIMYRLFRLFEVSEIIFVSIYTCEFLMKVYVEPIKYWRDGYNILDVVIIFIILIPYALRKIKGRHYKFLHIADGIQSLRILKLISYSRGIREDVGMVLPEWPYPNEETFPITEEWQPVVKATKALTLITAVGQTVYTVASVLTLLFVLMYIFAILGFCLFGMPEKGDLNNWGNLAAAFFTLFSLATVDGWTDLQEQLDQRKFTVSRAFTILFILLASFIFLNMFVGVMIMHTEDSIKKFQRELMVERHVTLMEEKQMILRRQQEEVNKLVNMQESGGKSFTEMVEEFKKTLRHTDPMVLDEFGTSLPFIDVYLSTLDNQDTTINKLQELYYEIANVLCLMLEDLPPREKSSHSSEFMI